MQILRNILRFRLNEVKIVLFNFIDDDTSIFWGIQSLSRCMDYNKLTAGKKHI